MKPRHQPVRVLIADDQTLFRSSLARMLASDPRLEVVGQAKDGEEAVSQALQHKPNVVLMDLQMPKLTGIEATRMLARSSPSVKVIAFSAFADKATVGEALASGAKSYVDKNVTIEEMIERILTLSSSRSRRNSRSAPKMTAREREVLSHLARGLSNKQIARRLGISEKTVRNHLSRAFGKLGAANRTEAVLSAMRFGLIVA